jgi:GT2 family glycosyltransferase
VDPSVTVVVATRNRRESLLRTLERLSRLPERPLVTVVDNGSSDGTASAVRSAAPGVELVEAGRNLGGAARNVGARRARTPFVAFADDDSWWADGSLALAERILTANASIGLVAARVLVGPDQHEDPVTALMAQSPLWDGHASVRRVLGFLACAAVVRRDAFLQAGGFHRRLGVGGEETLLALDMARGGWSLVYVPEAVVYHHPSPARDPTRRRRNELRNALWTSWLRRPRAHAVSRTAAVLRRLPTDRAAPGALREAAAGLPWALRVRRPVPAEIERELRLVEQSQMGLQKIDKQIARRLASNE